MPFISSNSTQLSAQVSLEMSQVILVDLPIAKDSCLPSGSLGNLLMTCVMLDTSDASRNHPSPARSSELDNSRGNIDV